MSISIMPMLRTVSTVAGITGSVTRGGGWKGKSKDLRASNRFYVHPAHRYSNQGFRLARTR